MQSYYFLIFVRELTKVGNVTFTMVVAFRFVFPFFLGGGGDWDWNRDGWGTVF